MTQSCAGCGSKKLKASAQFPGSKWCGVCGLDAQPDTSKKPGWLYGQNMFNDRRVQ